MPHARRKPRARGGSTAVDLRDTIRELEELDMIRADVARARDKLLEELLAEVYGPPDVIEEVSADIDSVMGPSYPRGDGRITNPQYDK